MPLKIGANLPFEFWPKPLVEFWNFDQKNFGIYDNSKHKEESKIKLKNDYCKSLLIIDIQN